MRPVRESRAGLEDHERIGGGASATHRGGDAIRRELVAAGDLRRRLVQPWDIPAEQPVDINGSRQPFIQRRPKGKPAAARPVDPGRKRVVRAREVRQLVRDDGPQLGRRERRQDGQPDH